MPTTTPTTDETKAAARIPMRIYSVVLCSECDAVFTDVSISSDKPLLPCGHTAARWMTAGCIHSGQAAEDFVQWADRKDLLDRAMNHLEKRGGKFDPHHHGPGGFVAPKKDRR